MTDDLPGGLEAVTGSEPVNVAHIAALGEKIRQTVVSAQPAVQEAGAAFVRFAKALGEVRFNMPAPDYREEWKP